MFNSRNLRVALLGIAACFTGAMSAQAAQVFISDPTVPFTNPTTVNLLEKWNTNGTYGLATTQSADAVLDSQKYRQAGSDNWRIGAVGNNQVFGRFTFDQPRRIDRLFVQWRNNNESPYNYTWTDQSGTFVSQNYYISPDVNGAGNFGPSNDSFAARTANFIEIRSTPVVAAGNETTPNGTWDVAKIGAFLTPGETLAMDGTYNIFYQENGAAPVAGNASLAGIWTNHTSDNGNPGGPDSITWKFSRAYLHNGSYLSHLGDAFALNSARVEVSTDGVNWTTAFGPSNVVGTTYMAFNPNSIGDWLRLSWDASGVGGGREIHEFQLFSVALVAVPEPSTLGLLGLGAIGLAVKTRRRRTTA